MSRRTGSDLRRLQLASFLSSADRFAMPPMLLAISRDLSVPLVQVVGAASAYFLAYGVMQPFWGVLSMRIGLARTMTWCVAAGGLATLAATFIGGVASLTVLRAVSGSMFSAAFPAALIYVGATAAATRRQREVTDLMTGVALGTALATAVAGVLTYLVGWRWMFALTGVLCLASVPFLARITELERTPWRDPLLRPMRRILRTGAVYQLLVLAVFDGAAILGTLTFLPVAVESTGSNAAIAAGVTAVFGIAVLLAARVVGRLSRAVTASRFILAGSLVGTAGCVILAASVGLAAALAGCVLLGVAWASMHSSLQTWATEVTPAERGLTVSLFAGSLFAGSALAAAWGAPIAQDQRFGLLFGVEAAVLLVTGLSGYIARARWESHH